MNETIQINRKEGVLYRDGIRIGVWRRDGAHLIQKEFESIIGPATRSIFREAAKQNINEVIMNHLKKKTDDKDDAKETAKYLLDYFMHLGYGLPELVQLDTKTKSGVVRINNSFNAFGFKGTKKPVCYILEGFLERLFEVAFNSRAECRETKCAASGHDFCEFRIRSISRPIETSYKHLKPVKGLTDIEIEFNPERGTLSSNKLNMILVPRGLQKRLETEAENTIGPATKGIFYSIGRLLCLEFVGRSFLKNFLVRMVCKLSRKIFINRLEDFSTLFSLGRLKFINVNKSDSTATLRLWNSWDAEGVKKSGKPVCYEMTGIIAAGNDFIFNRTMVAEETKCIAMGDPYCEFKAFPAQKD